MLKIRKQIKECVTRLGNFLHFGQLFKACGNNYFSQITHISGNFCKGVKIFNFSSGIIFGQLLQTFVDFLLVTLPVMAHLKKHLGDVGQCSTFFLNFAKNVFFQVAAIAPWFCLRQPSCGPRFESQAHHLHLFQFVLKL